MEVKKLFTKKIHCILWISIILVLFHLKTIYDFSWYQRLPSVIASNPNGSTEKVEQEKFIALDTTQHMEVCSLNLSSLGPIKVNKTKLTLKWVEQQHPSVKLGGIYAPDDCQSRHKVAILVPYRNRETNLIIFLHYIHTLLKKQLVRYRIYVVEQCAKDKFNKGTLFNIGFIESQRNETWQCYIFHDVDLIPLDERILYYCPRNPTHMSAAVESHGFRTPYLQMFGGVTALTPEHYRAVNGYSNEYWNWGAEDDDMFIRIQSRRLPVLRFNRTIARYAALPHEPNLVNYKRGETLQRTKRRFWQEGLSSVKYKLLNVENKKLFTHMLADVNPLNIKVK